MVHNQHIGFEIGHEDLGQMLGRLSHDLLSPVRAMTELTSWIDEELVEADITETSPIAEYLSLLRSRGARLERLVTNLSTYAGVGSTTERFDGHWDDIIDRVSQTIPGLENFHMTADFQAVPNIASDDLVVLFEVFLSNSVKHCTLRHGNIHVSSAVHGHKCYLVFEDDGPGIPFEMHQQAFRMCSTLNRQDLVEGSGLGLPIAQRIADHYAGGLTFHPPQDGKGCKIAIWFNVPAIC